MKAFIGRNFDAKDDDLTGKIKTFIESTGIECLGGEMSEPEPVSKKVKERIEACEIFVGVFTRDKPIYSNGQPSFWKQLLPFRKGAKVADGYTTSNWVIQESGYALGKDRKPIFLIEEGITDFPGLQGDMEYISFVRDAIEGKWVKLSEMLNKIKNGKDVESTVATEQAESPDTSKMEADKTAQAKGDKKQDIATEPRPLIKMYQCLFDDNDYKEAQRLFDSEVEATLEGSEKIDHKAALLRISHEIGDSTAFSKLEQLAKENDDHHVIIYQLALLYEHMGERERAVKEYKRAISKCDTDDSQQRAHLFRYYKSMASCMVNASHYGYEAAMDFMEKLLAESESQEDSADLLENMVNISKEADEIERLFVYAEAALAIDPLKTAVRFRLAYQYSNKGNDRLSLLHYLRYINSGRNDALNNLAVLYGSQGLPCKAVHAYNRAIDNKSMLAVGNLAHRYLNSGFSDDAKELIQKAKSLEQEGVELHERVIIAQQKLLSVKEEENEKREKLLSEANIEHGFRIDYSNAFLSEAETNANQIEGTWETPWGVGILTFNEEKKSFQIEAKRKEEHGALIAALSRINSQGQQASAPPLVVNTQIRGSVHKLSGSFTISGRAGGTILTTTGEKGDTGYLILSKDYIRIDTMQKTSDGKVTFSQWTKQSL